MRSIRPAPNYSDWTKSRLVERLGELERRIAELERAKSASDNKLAALKNYEVELLEVQHIAQIGHWERDIPTGKARYSPETCRMLGYDPENHRPTYQGFVDRVHPDDLEIVEQGIADAEQNGAPLDLVYRIVLPDGAVRFHHTRSEVFGGESGTPNRIAGTVQDVTDQVRARQALEQNEARLRAITSALPDLLFLLDEDGRYLEVLTSQTEFLHVDTMDVTGKRLSEVLPEDDAKLVLAAVRNTLDADGPRSIEYELSAHSGSWFEGRIAPISTLPGTKPAVVFLARDITERKRIEDELRLTQFTLDQGGDAVFWIGETGKFEYVNSSGQQMLGYSWDELATVNMWDVDLDVTQTEWPEIWARIGSRDRHTFETTHLTKDGDTVPVEVTTTPIDFAGRRLVCSFSRDITERKRIDEQLRQAQKMEAIGQLTGGVAHEFNNLLMVILANIELLEGKLPDNEDFRKRTSGARNGVRRGAELTQRLLAFSRNQQLKNQRLDLDRIVSEMGEMLRQTLGETITVEITSADGLWPTIADRGQVESAIVNLGINARDAMPAGGTIRIETTNVVLGSQQAAATPDGVAGDFVKLEFSDTGLGMTPEILEHVFEPFFTTKKVGEGTGLGLSMVFGFAKQSGGFVGIESVVGHGTTVRMYLPRAGEQETATQKETVASTPPKESDGTVLVVEDDPDVMSVVTNLLSMQGYRVVEARDGETALAIMEERDDLDLLFTDLVLKGGMSGADVAREVRRRRPRFRVIYTTGHPLSSIEDLMPDDEEPVIVHKPYEMAELTEKLAAVLKT
jgi:PAS domain S-box-containing protein